MKEQFTQGEWIISEDGKDFDILADDGELIATVFTSVTTLETDKANLDLIYQASKMYRLLQKFLPCDEDGNGIGDFVYSDGSECLGEEVIALLAEARGENKDTA